MVSYTSGKVGYTLYSNNGSVQNTENFRGRKYAFQEDVLSILQDRLRIGKIGFICFKKILGWL